MDYYIKNKDVNNINIFSSLNECLKYVSSYDTIYIECDLYEKVYIKIPNLTIIGINKPTIFYDAYHGMIIKKEHGGGGIKTYGTTGSATFTVLKEALNFHMENIIIKNSYLRKYEDIHTQNVAFKTESINGLYKNVDFISTQDTLYIDNNDNLIDNCYIEGDVDFVFGCGNAIIKDSKIRLLKVLKSNAYICAPDTYISNDYGFLFYNCDFLCQEDNEKYLGRPWYPSGAKEEVRPKVMFMTSRFVGNINMHMITMHKGDPSNYELYISNCWYNDNLINSTNEKIDNKYLKYLNKIIGE